MIAAMNSPRSLRVVAFLVLPLCAVGLPAAEAADPSAPAPAALQEAGLTSAQLLAGLKSGFGAMIDGAADEMTKPGAVDVAPPSSMKKLEAALQRMNQSGALDSFKATLNQAAVSVAPQTTAALKAAVGPLTLNDASAVLRGEPDSATQLLRTSTESAVRTQLLPLMSQALATNGTAAQLKALVSKAGPMASMLGAPSMADLETSLVSQLLDTCFGYLSKQEAALRADPSALKNADAKKVFGLAQK